MDIEKTPIVGLLVLNYNDHKVTRAFCQHMASYRSINLIVIVDNHSTDDSFAQLSALSSTKIHVIQTGENGGYAKGNNAGLRYFESTFPVDIVIISNPDIEIDEDTLNHTLSFMAKSHTKIGLVSPSMSLLHGHMPVAWKLPSYTTALMRAVIPLRPWIDRQLAYDDQTLSKPVATVDVLPGSLLFAYFEVLKTVDFFDERTFLFGEENILSFKLKKNGYQNILLGDHHYLHAHSLTINKNLKSLSSKFHIALESDLIYFRAYKNTGPVRLFVLKLVYELGLWLFLVLKWGQKRFISSEKSR